jgi:signal peptidase complex subunit 2
MPSSSKTKKGASAAAADTPPIIVQATALVPDNTTNTNTNNNNNNVDDQQPLELLQVDLGDMVKVKQVLDEAVSASLLDNSKLPEDVHWDTMKLIIMATACVFAMVAQFAPISFPESRPLLGVCGSCYFLLSGLLQFMTTYIDQDVILWTLKQEKSSNPLLQTHGVRVRSNLPRFSEYYSVVLELKDCPQQKQVEQTWSIGQFFDKEGYFDEVGLNEEVDKLYAQLVEGKYTTAKTEALKEKKN